MHFEKIHHLHFAHHKVNYRATVSEVRFQGGNAIYKITIGNQRYWLIRRNSEWGFIADLPPETYVQLFLMRKTKKLNTY